MLESSSVKKIRVMIVDDSPLFRTTLEQRLGSRARFEICATAVDPVDAMNKIKTVNPDVITMDVEMPKMNGIDFIKKLLPTHPVPVVVVTSLPMNALDALQAGAVDFVRKPTITNQNDMNQFINELASKISVASTARVAHKNSVANTISALASLRRPMDDMVIAIGASTGGTEAILQVVRDLPASMPGIVIVQHIPPVFSKMYAQRLDGICKMRVKEATHGDRVERGKIIIGAGEFHLRLAKDSRGYYVKSEQGARVSGHCPSVNVLFDSVAQTARDRSVGVILTGMGSDGATGLLNMAKAGAYTIGQDQASCVVYGMPMEAYKIGAVKKQLPLSQISGEMIRYLNSL